MISIAATLRRFFAAAFPFAPGLLALLNYAACRPGQMSQDSWVQFHQAQYGYFFDVHPPVMAVWWSLLNHISQGPQSMLAFHLAVFWGALYVLGSSFLPHSPLRAYACLLIGFFPPLMGMTAVIWKDSGLTVSWMLAAALLLRCALTGRKPNWKLFLVVQIALFYGAAVRHNAITALLPLCLWSMVIMFPARHWRFLLVGGVLLFMAQWGTITLVNRALTDQKMYAQQHVYYQDLASLSLAEKQNLFPPFIVERGFSQQSLERLRLPLRYNPFQVEGPINWTSDPNDIRTLRQYWLDAILHYPADYLYYRWQSFAAFMRIGYDQGCYPYHWYPPSNSLPTRLFNTLLTASEHSWLYLTWLWVLFLLAQGGAGFWLRKRQPALGNSLLFISTTGLSFLLPYFFYVPSCDFRYAYAAVGLAMTAIMALICSYKFPTLKA